MGLNLPPPGHGTTISRESSVTQISTQTAGQGFTFNYQPGEWHLYTTKKLPKPDISPYKAPASGAGISTIKNNNINVVDCYP